MGVGGKCEEGWNCVVQARLVMEPGNRYDADAVKVEVDGALVGYMARDQAKAY